MKKTWLTLIAVCCAAASAAAQQGTLLVSELLFQPRSHEAEYVELYNASDLPIELADYHIVRWIGDSLGTHYPLPYHILRPHTYVALSKDIASVRSCYHVEPGAALLECNLPTYPNGGSSVVVCTADTVVVDRFDYLPSMHSRLLRDKAGVSLERRSFDRPTGDVSNWFSASSISGYGTPGYANSQSCEWIAEETAFDFSGTLFSPDGDGYQDELVIEYQLENGDLAARAEVYDARGLMVRRLLNNDLLGPHGSITWNGRGDNGNPLPQGQYIIQFILYNTGGTQQTLRRTIALVTR